MSTVNLLKRIIPPLTSALHKGQMGKICIIGGCREYTGAPFYAGISAQRAVGNVFVLMNKRLGSGLCYNHLQRGSGNSNQVLLSRTHCIPVDSFR